MGRRGGFDRPWRRAWPPTALEKSSLYEFVGKVEWVGVPLGRILFIVMRSVLENAFKMAKYVCLFCVSVVLRKDFTGHVLMVLTVSLRAW